MRRQTRGRARRAKGGGIFRKILILATVAFVCLGVVYFARMTQQTWAVLQQHRVRGRSLWQLFKARLWEEDLPAPSRLSPRGGNTPSTLRKPTTAKPKSKPKRKGPLPPSSSPGLRKKPSRSKEPPSQPFSSRDRAKLKGILRKSLQPHPKKN